nr:phosphatidate cytidylyltransferase [Candidatus Sigynarchaeota archaeon]
MNRRLTKIGLVLVGIFFVLVLVGPMIIPYREFVASTSPDRLPFRLSGVESVSLTSLPGDHVVICYIDNESIWYKESATRGFSWADQELLVASNLTGAGNLFAMTVETGTGNAILLAWDALLEPSNQSSRRAFFAVMNLTTSTIIAGPVLCSNLGGPRVEQFPTIAGNAATGYEMSWMVNNSGVYSIATRSMTSSFTLGSATTLALGTDSITSPAVLMDSGGAFDLFYVQRNGTGTHVIHKDFLPGNTFSSGSSIFDSNSTLDPVKDFDYSFTSVDDLILSFEANITNGSAARIDSEIYFFPRGMNFTSVRRSTIENNTGAQFLQHERFSNDQVITIWVENAIGHVGQQDIAFFITDFDMNNKNSTVHSILLAYIFFACGIFNFFVFLHLKQRKRFEQESEPINNIAMTMCFVVVAVLMLLPFTGFQGERLGESYADGFIFPAPINLATVIVIGFVFLFFLVSTPLIDKFWHRDAPTREFKSTLLAEKSPFSWKQEILRKIPHICVALLIIGFDPIGSSLMQFVDIQKYDRYNFVNEGAIIFDYVLRLNNLEIGSYAVKLVIAAGLVFLWVLDLHVLLASPKTYFFMKDYFFYTFRKKEKSSMADFVVMFASLLLMIIILTFNPAYKLQGTFVCFAGFCSLCFGDTAGVFVGKSIGKHPFPFYKKKTWEGAIAGTGISFLCALLFVSWPFAFLVAGLYLLVDMITPRLPISDNLLIPVLIALVFLPILPYINSPLMGFYV